MLWYFSGETKLTGPRSVRRAVCSVGVSLTCPETAPVCMLFTPSCLLADLVILRPHTFQVHANPAWFNTDVFRSNLIPTTTTGWLANIWNRSILPRNCLPTVTHNRSRRSLLKKTSPGRLSAKIKNHQATFTEWNTGMTLADLHISSPFYHGRTYHSASEQ